MLLWQPLLHAVVSEAVALLLDVHPLSDLQHQLRMLVSFLFCGPLESCGNQKEASCLASKHFEDHFLS